MRSIGEMARDSGLSVSALRFYDGAGVLAPAWTDPQTGYRWYDDGQVGDARLVARLRRVGMPLPEIRRVLDERDGRLLDAHLRRLEVGLADARRELSSVRALLEPEDMTMTRLKVPAPELASALDAVRFAASSDPERPSLCGVLFDVEDGVLTLVATDRYRLAVSRVSVMEPDAAVRVSVIVPVPLVDEIRALADAGDVELAFDGKDVAATAAGRRVAGERLDHDFPDYRQLLRVETTHRVTVRTAELRERVAAGPEVSVLDLVPELRVAVNREFLLDALTAADGGQLVLELGGPIAPLAIRSPDREGTMSLLMPIRR
ncbi:MerR family transcriptional regulator [Streptomyces sp. NBC_01537]|uniref:DNA polymerase III subunit beta family protein n=1 Tax=Streptomyces sp. NBC_01537 TaxID=2903896 RepID=UPI00386BD7BE